MDDPDQDNNNRMDLAFNADFDSSLLNWDSAAPSGVNKDNEAKAGGSDTNSMSNHSPRTHGHGASWDSSNGAAGFSQLPAFTMEEERQKFGKTNSNASNSANTNTGNGGTAAAASQSSDGAASQSSQSWQMMQQKAQQQQQEQQQQQQLMVAAAGAVHQNMVAAMANNGTNEHKTPAPADAQQQSNGNGTTQQASTKSDSSQSQQQQQQANQLSNALEMASDSMTAATTNNTHMHPLAISSAANCPPHIIAAHQMQAAAGMQNALFPVAALSTLGANAAAAFAAAGFALPTVTATTTENNQKTNTSQQEQQQQQQQLNANALLFSTQALQLQQQQQNTTAVNLQQQQQAPQTTDTSATNSPPPFYLFDAPAELRINFTQSQRMHGLPVTEDSNSYHYGVAVNGFHPQLNAQLNPAAAGSMQQHVVGGSVTASSSSGSHHHQANGSVQLIDARHSNRKSGRIKNEREQRRAQKITELIDQLREKMESGGWKVEMKSKFHTLSSCADYVKHLIKETKEKEDAVSKAKSDLQMKQNKVEEEKASQSRSDPESVMSGLTSSTGESGASSSTTNKAHKVSSENSSEGERKRKSSSCSSDETDSSKKSRKTNDESSSGDDQACQDSNQRSLDKTASSFSDITDSNKGSSNSGSDTQLSNQRSDDDDASEAPSSLSASSSAAVALGRESKRRHTKHADVVIKGRSDRKIKIPAEVTSLEESFVLDYEEVFVKSNVPQIVATTAGKIIAWNEFFLKATGISRPGVQGLTIFSLVKPEKLSNLFEIVAKALRKDPPPIATGSADSTSEFSSTPASDPKLNYDSMTLPCIEFPASRERSNSDAAVNPLHVTVTLMADEDPRKRLFHCVFTDCPGSDDGALGSITPELLARLFIRHRGSKLSASRKSEKAAKKARTS